MSKTSNLILVIGGLLIVLAFVLLYTPLYHHIWREQPVRPNLNLTRPAVTKPIPPPVTREAKAEPKPLPVVPVAAPPKFVVLRDPFEVNFAFTKREEGPAEGGPPSEAPKPVLQLQGIFLSPGVEAAIIDDQVVGVGSRVALGWKVAGIQADRVILSQKGKQKVLRIKLGVE